MCKIHLRAFLHLAENRFLYSLKVLKLNTIITCYAFKQSRKMLFAQFSFQTIKRSDNPYPRLTMCEKRPNESWRAYMCRHVVEQPQAVLAVIGIAAAIVLYCDLRSFIAEQAEAQEKTIRVLSEMSVRLQTIEHRMEVYHMQPPSVTKQTSPAE